MKNMIKIISLTALCFLFLSPSSTAQQRNHIYLGYGGASVESISNELADIIISATTGGNVTTANSKYSGALFAGYRSYVTEKLEVGGTFVYERASKDVLENDQKSGSVSTNTYALLAEMKYNYINQRKFKLHSGLGAGMSHTRVSTKEDVHEPNKETLNNFAYQLDVIGLTYGDQLSISANAGFGSKGIINAVLAYGF